MIVSDAPSPANTKSQSFSIRPLDAVLGAEIIGADLSLPLPETDLRRIEKAFLAHKVLVFRDQHLSKQQLANFSCHWGPLGEHIMPGSAADDIPVVAVASNADAKGKPNGKHTDESAKRWHTDRSFMPRPAVATLFYGVTVPRSGGDTLFADTVSAYESLPAAMKMRIDPLTTIHWVGHTRSKENGGGGVTEEELRKAPPVKHPLARPHAITGKKAIYCGCHAWKIDGWSEADSKELFDELVEHATQESFVYRHKWQPNDLVMWDNRCTLHAATDFDGAKDLRLMYRTIVEQEIADQ